MAEQLRVGKTTFTKREGNWQYDSSAGKLLLSEHQGLWSAWLIMDQGTIAGDTEYLAQAAVASLHKYIKRADCMLCVG